MKIDIVDIKDVYVVWTNTDLNEGRGQEYPFKICEEKATARRFAKGNDVQGTDCRISKAKVCKINGLNDDNAVKFWYLGPVIIERPTTEDKKVQQQIDEYETVMQKAMDSGMTEEDIAIMVRGL